MCRWNTTLKRVDILSWQTMIHFNKTLIAIKSIAVDNGKWIKIHTRFRSPHGFPIENA